MSPWGHSKGKTKVQEMVEEAEGSNTTTDLALLAAADQELDRASRPYVFKHFVQRNFTNLITT